MADLTKNHPQPSIRRLLQFSLKSALILMTLLCIGLGTWTYRSQRQKVAVEAITEAGGEFGYSYQIVETRPPRSARALGSMIVKPYSYETEPAAPSWLRNLIGDHYFITPTRLVIGTPGHFLESPMEPMTRTQGKFDPNCLAHLKALPHLEELWSANVELDDADLANLRHLRKLKFLELRRGALSGSAPPRNFDFLRRLRKLESLCLTDSQFGDSDVAHILQTSTLKNLFLYGSAIGDGGVAQIRRLTNLELLGLSGTNVTDTGVAHLSGLQKLQYLALGDCNITDAAIPHLSLMKGLRRVELSRTKVTEKGLRDLRQALPQCDVHWFTPRVDAGGG